MNWDLANYITGFIVCVLPVLWIGFWATGGRRKRRREGEVAARASRHESGDVAVPARPAQTEMYYRIRVMQSAPPLYTSLPIGNGHCVFRLTPAFQQCLEHPKLRWPICGDVIAIDAGLGVLEYRIVGLEADRIHVEVVEMPWRAQPDPNGECGG